MAQLEPEEQTPLPFVGRFSSWVQRLSLVCNTGEKDVGKRRRGNGTHEERRYWASTIGWDEVDTGKRAETGGGTVRNG